MTFKSSILSAFPDVLFGFTPRKNGVDRPPFHFNMSLSVGDDERTVLANREQFCRETGIEYTAVAHQRQVHGDTVTVVTSPGLQGESDAMITEKPGIGLAISTADCPAVFLYDERRRALGAVHSGWRGTEKRIVEKTVDAMVREFGSSPEDMTAYLAPSISQRHYEVGPDVAGRFDERYVEHNNGSLYLDVAASCYDMLTGAGLSSARIQRSALCSFADGNMLHSYRRWGTVSGRAWGLIAMRPAG